MKHAKAYHTMANYYLNQRRIENSAKPRQRPFQKTVYSLNPLTNFARSSSLDARLVSDYVRVKILPKNFFSTCSPCQLAEGGPVLIV